MWSAREYFERVNAIIDGMSDEELSRLLEEIENGRKNSDEEFCYDFQMVNPSILHRKKKILQNGSVQKWNKKRYGKL